MINEIIRPLWDKYAALDNSVNTWCNAFVAEVMRKYGYNGFDGKVANSIVSILQHDKQWLCITAETWDKSSLVVCGASGEPHGHVNLLIEGEYVESGKWGKKVPLCANIGKTNFWGKGVNWAFQKEPTYYQWTNNIILKT